jgi:hypothetical protein
MKITKNNNGKHIIDFEGLEIVTSDVTRKGLCISWESDFFNVEEDIDLEIRNSVILHKL